MNTTFIISSEKRNKGIYGKPKCLNIIRVPIRYILSSIAALLIFCSCGKIAMDMLQKEIDELNKQCPVDMGMMGELTKVSLDQIDKSVNFYYSLSDDMITVEELRQNEDLVLNSMKLSIAKSQMKAMIEEMIKADVSLKLHLASSSNPSDVITMTITPEEMENITKAERSDVSINTDVLANQIKLENSRCPYIVDEGLEMTKVEDDGSQIVYYCKADENLYNMKELKDMSNELKEVMAETFSDPLMKNEIKMYVSLNKGIKYVYYGDKSGKEVNIVYSVKELENYL